MMPSEFKLFAVLLTPPDEPIAEISPPCKQVISALLPPVLPGGDF